MERVIAVASIAFNPIFWNLVARNEYHNKTMSRFVARLFGSDGTDLQYRRIACYILALTIFALGILRDGLYYKAIVAASRDSQDRVHGIYSFHIDVHEIAHSIFPVLIHVIPPVDTRNPFDRDPNVGLRLLREAVSKFMSQYVDQNCCSFNVVQVVGVIFIAVGNVFVLSSMWALGIIGTYLGDYFGILMDERVTGFPFNLTDHPMYGGSTLIFLGTALWHQSWTGIGLTLFVALVYAIASYFEGYSKFILIN